MSWFFINCGKAQGSSAALPECQYHLRLGSFEVRAGGPEQTCIFHSDEPSQTGFVVCGAGLVDDGNRVRLMGPTDWMQRLSSKTINLDSLDGHFACVVWDKGNVRFFNDQLGIREIFFLSSSDSFILSTQLNWLSETLSERILDTSSFGGKWYLYIQSDHNSPIQEINRLGPGGSAEFEVHDGLNIHRKQGDFNYDAISDLLAATTIADKIKRYSQFPIASGDKTILSLSGGVDSRLILAALEDCSRDQWEAFTLGYSSDADVRVAMLLSEKLGFKLELIEPPAISIEDAVEFVTSTDIFKPLSGAYAHLSYGQVQPGIIVDGAPGELLRRRLFTKLEHFGARAVAKHNWENVAQFLWTERPDIWSKELGLRLRERAVDQVATFCATMPSSKAIGIGNWIDTLFCRLWFANTHGAEQRRLDGITVSTSPFTQPSILIDVFRAREGYRKSGKLARDVGQLLSPAVMKFPYAKDEVIFPSSLPWYLAKLYGKLAMRRSPVLNDQARFLREFKVTILDSLHSQQVKDCSLYDYGKLARNITAYYAGEEHHAAFIDWWFSFEIWRRANRVTDWS
jgi:hypothetical protein